MGLSSHEKMNVLLEQIKLDQTDQQHYFEQAELQKLEVFKQEKRWIFHCKFKQVLPVELFRLFRIRLQETFSPIAKITFQLNYDDQTVDSVQMCDYWRDFIDIEQVLSPAYSVKFKE